jgi:uncharacterized membrane protein (DUF4010 family)
MSFVDYFAVRPLPRTAFLGMEGACQPPTSQTLFPIGRICPPRFGSLWPWDAACLLALSGNTMARPELERSAWLRCWVISAEALAILSMIFVGVMVCFLNWRQLALHQTLGLTTSAAFLIVGFAGVLCGEGHTFTPVAVAVITAALLAWKQPISGFAVGLSDLELRSAILLAILSFIVYPVLPTHAIDQWGLIEPQTIWATVILIAALGFVNYVLWKIYGPRGVDIGSFLGGLVNSTATVAELAQRVKESGGKLLAVAYRGVILATAAMLFRNSLLLAILAWPALVSGLVPMVLMVLPACSSLGEA